MCNCIVREGGGGGYEMCNCIVREEEGGGGYVMCNCMDSWAELLPGHSFTSSHPPGMNSIILNSNKGRPTDSEPDNIGLKPIQCEISDNEKRAWSDVRW